MPDTRKPLPGGKLWYECGGSSIAVYGSKHSASHPRARVVFWHEVEGDYPSRASALRAAALFALAEDAVGACADRVDDIPTVADLVRKGVHHREIPAGLEKAVRVADAFAAFERAQAPELSPAARLAEAAESVVALPTMEVICALADALAEYKASTEDVSTCPK